MAERVLLDTGFVVALLNDRDRDHERCRAWLENAGPLQVATVEGVLVECCHLLRKRVDGPVRAIQAFFAMAPTIVPLGADRAARIAEGMVRYRDVPMDFVDGHLVVAAEDLQVSRILTLDRRGFATYRIGTRGRFEICPD